MRKWLIRIAVGIFGVLALLVAVVLVQFARWRSGIEHDLSTSSTVIATARGPIEYAELGHGPAVVMIHGTPGGYDDPLNLLRTTHAERDGFLYIAPSRPGYLRTPLSVGATAAEQADALAALLDALHIHRAAIIADSGGGPSALQFALRYPQRCSALVLQEALIRRYSGPAPQLPTTTLGADYRDLRIYLLNEVAGYYWSDPKYAEPLAIARAALRASVPYGLRRAGTENDLAQEARIAGWPLSEIHCPTLILQGTADQSVPVSDAEFAHAQIAGSQLVEVPGEGHMMVITRHAMLHKRIEAFLREHR